MKESPKPNMMPRTTGLVASLAIGLIAPVSAGQKPEKSRGQARSEKGRRADAPGNGRRPDGFHGLDRKRGPVIEPGGQQGYAEHEKKPERVYFHDGDIGNHKRDQGADVAEGPGPLHLIVEVFGFLPAGLGSGFKPILLGREVFSLTIRCHGSTLLISCKFGFNVPSQRRTLRKQPNGKNTADNNNIQEVYLF